MSIRPPFSLSPLAALCIAAGVIGLSGPASVQAADKVKVGFVSTLSGPHQA